MEASETNLCPTAILVDLNFSDNSGNKGSFSMSDILHLSDMGEVSHCSAISGLEMEISKGDGELKIDEDPNLLLDDEIENEKFEFQLSGLPDILEESSKNELDENMSSIDLGNLWNPEIAKEANKISRRLSLPRNQLTSKLMAFSPILSSISGNAPNRSSSLSSNKSSQYSPHWRLESDRVNSSGKENDSALANRQPEVSRTVKLVSTSTDNDSPVFFSPSEQDLQSSPYPTTHNLKIQLEKSSDNSAKEKLETTNIMESSIRKFTYTVEAHGLLDDVERPIVIDQVSKLEDTKQNSLCRVPSIRKDTYLVEEKHLGVVENKSNARTRHLSGPSTPSRTKDPKITKPQMIKSKSFNDHSRTPNSGGAKVFNKPHAVPVCKPSLVPPSKQSLQTLRTTINNSTRPTIIQNFSRIAAPKRKPGPIKVSQNFPAVTKKNPIHDPQPCQNAPTTPAKASTAADKPRTPKPVFSTPQKNDRTISTPGRKSMMPASNTSGGHFSTPSRRSMIPVTPLTPRRKSGLPTLTPGRRKSTPEVQAGSKARLPGKIEVPKEECKGISRLPSPNRKARK